jgi:diguanylate cyclase (GGDEF)-like protein
MLLLASLILPITVAYALSDRAHTRQRVDQTLTARVAVEVGSLTNYFERARAITLISSRNPALGSFYTAPGSRNSRLHTVGRPGGQISGALRFLETLYPTSIGEVCFIDHSGAENARIVEGRAAPIKNLSSDEKSNPFFGPTFALPPGEVYQAQPYVSPDTHEWVVSNSTPVPTVDGRAPAIVHYEVTMESFRAQARATAGDGEIEIIDRDTGKIIMSSALAQKIGAPLGEPKSKEFLHLADSSSTQGLTQHGTIRSSYRSVPSSVGNANHWIVVASSPTESGILGDFSLLSIFLCVSALGLFTTALLSFGSSHHGLEVAVLTDALTGLGSRRKLLADIEASIASSSDECPTALVLCDLDGFKTYNDTFGHPAGDQLLATLGSKLNAALADRGRAYRMGGDEFCALVPLEGQDISAVMDLVSAALSEEAEAFHIRCSRGSVLLPTETRNVSEALRISDRRMYQHKNHERASAGNQSTRVLLQALRETDAILGDHVSVVARRAELLGRKLGLDDAQLQQVRQGAQLHDIGKIAIPELILNKAGRLNRREWAFMKTHTLVGERILGAAPALAEVSKLVRSSHERFDGSGYPDKLAGDKIPMGSRIIFVCDAFDAITSNRSYQAAKTVEKALEEMQRCAGTQFDPDVLAAFCEVMTTEEAVAAPV